MKNIIVGTAGHIDHGKTSLVKALTGTDADRLQEEKKRGITIDLGFAHLQLSPGIRLGFVDVPGHERFVKNMLAGAGGIDLVLLVVAADESIKPQTREHFDICRLLGMREGIIVLTKSDLVPPDLLELARIEVEEFVAGSFLQHAPVIPVSSVSGEGITELRAALEATALRLTAKNASGPARLPVDRSFSMRGFGTVATGTLISGVVQKEQELELLPSGRVLRVRGVESYGDAVSSASAGTRTAVNLSGIQPREIQRGMTLAEKGSFEPGVMVDCHLELLRSARALRNLAPVHFHSGTAEIEARVRLFGKRELAPGSSAFARLRLTEPAVLVPGDRFILRQFSPVITIGGGIVIDPHPPREKKPARVEARLTVLHGNDRNAKAALLLEENPGGLGIARLAGRLAVLPEEALALARATGAMVLERPSWAVSRAWLNARRVDFLQAVKQHHAREPLSPGMSKQALRSSLPGIQHFVVDAILEGIPELITEGDFVRHRAHRVALSSGDEGARRKIEEAFSSAGLRVPSVAEVLSSAGVDQSRGQTILRMLLKERVLIRVSDDLVFHQSAIQNLRSILASRRSEVFTVSAFKEWTGVSRKYAVPLLEFLDREHVTLRKGDSRVVI